MALPELSAVYIVGDTVCQITADQGTVKVEISPQGIRLAVKVQVFLSCLRLCYIVSYCSRHSGYCCRFPISRLMLLIDWQKEHPVNNLYHYLRQFSFRTVGGRKLRGSWLTVILYL